MKSAKDARIGDTFKHITTDIIPEEGFLPAKPLVYCGIYPEDPEHYSELDKSI